MKRPVNAQFMGDVMNTATAVQRLGHFNRKAARLSSSKFISAVVAQRPVFRLSTGDRCPEAVVPDADATEAVVLTLRMFLQDEPDLISLRKIAQLYDEIALPQYLREAFDNIRSAFNNYLDEVCIHLDAQPLTRRNLLDVFLYGELAHIDADKAATFRRITCQAAPEAYARMLFASTVRDCIVTISLLRSVNELTIAELQR